MALISKWLPKFRPPFAAREKIRLTRRGDVLPSRSSELDRTIDRYLGIPLLYLIGLLRPRRALPSAPKRIGIIQPTAIGDMILTSGLLLHLRSCWPDAEIHLFHGPSNASAVPLLPVDVIAHCGRFKRPWQVLTELRGARLDLLINCVTWTRLTAILTALSGAGATLGFRSKGQHIHYAYDKSVDHALDHHELENYHALANSLKKLSYYRVALRPMVPQVAVDPGLSRTVLLHMFAGGSRAKQKSWPATNWADLATRLVNAGWIVGFTGSAGDTLEVQKVITEAQLPPDSVICLAGRLNLPQLAHALTRVPLLVTIDTGIAHLAAAVNAVVIGLHGPTRFERWGACNARASGLNAPHPSAGYIRFGFERHPDGDEIMARLSVDAVFAAVMAKLESAAIPAASFAD